MIDSKIEIEYPDKTLSKSEFETQINNFETRFECRLPQVFKDFLFKYGDAFVQTSISILEPNPLADEVVLDFFFGFGEDENITENTDIADGFPVAIPFAGDMMGNWFYLYLGHSQKESKVFFHDNQQRFYWSDEEFYSRFENIAPEIESYLTKRRAGQLPEKEEKFDNFYVLSETFEDFLQNLKPLKCTD